MFGSDDPSFGLGISGHVERGVDRAGSKRLVVRNPIIPYNFKEHLVLKVLCLLQVIPGFLSSIVWRETLPLN